MDLALVAGAEGGRGKEGRERRVRRREGEGEYNTKSMRNKFRQKIQNCITYKKCLASCKLQIVQAEGCRLKVEG